MGDERTPPKRFAITYVGGTSPYVLAFVRALAERAGSLPPLEVRLVGRDGERASLMEHAARRRAERAGADHLYVGSVDLARAVESSDLVIHAARIGGYAGRHADETLSLGFGLPGDESIGPGGLASALRAVPYCRMLAETIRVHAPQASVMMLANPLGILLRSFIGRTLPAFGLCELPGVTLRRALRMVGVAEEEVRADYVGINHQGFWTSIDHRGRSLIPAIAEAVADGRDDGFFKVDAAEIRRLGALPLPYMRLFIHRDRETASMRGRATSRAHELDGLSRRIMRAIAAEDDVEADRLLGTRDTCWFELAVVPAIESIATGRRRELYLSVQNDGYLTGLPDDAIVEKRGVLAGSSFQAAVLSQQALDDLPRRIPFLRSVATFERLAHVAATSRDVDSVHAALVSHPFGIDTETAERLASAILAQEVAVSS